MMTSRVSLHDESWLLLPWLANGRLSGPERARVEEHVRGCAACTQELTVQRTLCTVLTEPERVTYAPGPSLRKLMERIDGHVPAQPQLQRPAPRARRAGATLALAWRPPGLAWAASFVFTLGLGVLLATTYRGLQPAYSTYTSAAPATADVLHIAFERALPVGDVEELLHSAGARVVEGPDRSGIFGVAPVSIAAPHVRGVEVSPEMRTLAARLQADARVRWIEPLATDRAPDNTQGQRSREP